jgi:acyl dehydratase
MTIIEKYWDDASEGDECASPTYTVTKERILAYADLTGDHTPVHVADGLKTQSDYRFLPGMSLGWTWDFNLPIKVNDVLHVKFRIGTMRASKSRPDWGIVLLPSELVNQDGKVVQHGEHRLMVPRRPGAF